MSELLRAPAGVPPLVHRAAMTREHGAYAFDFFRSAWWCQQCQAHVASGPPAAIITLVAYADVDSFVANVEAAAIVAVEDADSAPACESCGQRGVIDYLDYHSFCSTKGADLVARFRSSRPIELLWWSSDAGYRPASSDTETRSAFTRDALLRAAKAARESSDEARADEALHAASLAIPGDPDLLVFMPWLSSRRKTELATAIADGHARLRPQDPDGWYWLAQIGLELVAAGGQPPALLAEVEQHVQRALAIAPGHAQALVASANVARLKGDEAKAIATLERLLVMHPGHPEGSYTLGLLLIERNPARALACFEAGERAQPNDPDYPRGRARALVALDRYPEARVAASRARDLAPDDPRVLELLSLLAQ